MSDERKPHPKNAPGPFYVVDGCCVTCLAPHQQAPTLMGFDAVEENCFVKQQPQTEDEKAQAIRAVWSAELQCLRYKGNDPEILRRLAEIGVADVCDLALLRASTPILRNHVTFKAAFANDPWEVGLTLRHYILSNNPENVNFKVTPLERQADVVRFAYSWYEDRFYTLNVMRGEPATDRFLVHHSPTWEVGSVAVSLEVDDWLRSDPRCSNFRWYTSDAWRRAGDDWQERPY